MEEQGTFHYALAPLELSTERDWNTKRLNAATRAHMARLKHQKRIPALLEQCNRTRLKTLCRQIARERESALCGTTLKHHSVVMGADGLYSEENGIHIPLHQYWKARLKREE